MSIRDIVATLLGERNANKAYGKYLQYKLTLFRSIKYPRSATRYEPTRLPIKRYGSPDHQVFFGYYDLVPFNYDSSVLLACRAPAPNVPPEKDTVCEIGYYEMGDHKRFVKIDETTTWCWQQGCRLQWYPLNEQGKNQTVIYNKLQNGKYGCTIQRIDNRTVLAEYQSPVYAVSPEGSYGLFLNFSRLHRLRPGYGYAALPDQSRGRLAPSDDGIWRIDFESGKVTLLFSIADIIRLDPLSTMQGSEHYFNHICVNPDGTRFFFFHIWCSHGKRYTRIITCNVDGSEPYVLINEGYVSHYAWKSNDEILCFSSHRATGTGYHLYRDKSRQYKVVGEKLLSEDGHPSYLPNVNYIITDTYPDRYGDSQLLLFDTENAVLHDLGRFYCPHNYRGRVRCDLHPRCSPNGRYVCIDSPQDGHRAMYILDISTLKTLPHECLDTGSNNRIVSLIIDKLWCLMRKDRGFRLARIWSNNELRKFAPLFKGNVVNVSAWEDKDKEGKYYRSYFSNANAYYCTNYPGERGYQGKEDEIDLDLTCALPSDLRYKFDVVFNHTTLEHIFEVRKAFQNLCSLSKDIVIIVVPFMQVQHETESYGDYWRFTPTCLRALFKENGFEVVYEAESLCRNSSVYLFFVGSRDPGRWGKMIPNYKPVQEARIGLGVRLTSKLFQTIKRNLF